MPRLKVSDASHRTIARRAGVPFAIGLSVAALSGCAATSASKSLHANLTESDVSLAATTMNAALEHAGHGETRTWHNPETGHAGAVMPQRTYLSEAGSYCRGYQETLTVDGRSERSSSIACRDADGLWCWVD
jgi:surface antigen